MPLITPAADAYHAIAAVTIPAQPPACRNHGVMPWESGPLERGTDQGSRSYG